MNTITADDWKRALESARAQKNQAQEDIHAEVVRRAIDLLPDTDLRLWEPSLAVPAFNERLRGQVEYLTLLLKSYREEAAAIAASQVGLPLRFFVTDPRTGVEAVIINPSVKNRSAATARLQEGCMNFQRGKLKVLVERSLRIRACWQRIDGTICEATLRDFAARVFLHETDHCDGICIFPKPTA